MQKLGVILIMPTQDLPNPCQHTLFLCQCWKMAKCTRVLVQSVLSKLYRDGEGQCEKRSFSTITVSRLTGRITHATWFTKCLLERFDAYSTRLPTTKQVTPSLSAIFNMSFELVVTNERKTPCDYH